MKVLSNEQIEQISQTVEDMGFSELPVRLPSELLKALRQDVCELLPTTKLAIGLIHQTRLTPLPHLAAEFLSSEAMIQILAAFFGGRFFRTRCCLNFCEASDQLDPHIDVPIHEYEVTMIVCANTEKTGTSTQQTGLVMRVYGRQEPRPTVARATTVLTETGIIVVGYGSEFWHERPMLQPDERVVAWTGYYGNL